MVQRARTIQIRQYIIDHVSRHPGDIVARTAGRFSISRQAAARHIRAMMESGVLEGEGQTRSRIYRLREVQRVSRRLTVSGLEEDLSWKSDVSPILKDIPRNIFDICHYGFTEMLNNAIDHSGSEKVLIDCGRTAEGISLRIADQGVGIFRKIRDALGLPDEIAAIGELAKGKLTTDPAQHTGEGIFFTSRAFDHFSILSGRLFFSHVRPNDDWLIEDRNKETSGTYVDMVISLKSPTQLKRVFDQFVSDDDGFEFSKTHVPVSLHQYGSDNLIARSQAKRLLSRFEMFREVILDFDGVEMIGQAFADEIFRVYQNAHPDMKFVPVRANDDVKAMIERAIRKRKQQHSPGQSPPAK